MNHAHIDHAEMDDVLRDLRAELDVTPSPEFAAKVRARVAETAASRASRWVMWGALAATAAGVIAFAMTRTTGMIAPPAERGPAIVMTAAPPAVPEPVPNVAGPTRKGPVRKPARAASAPAAPDAPRATTPPVLEVITNQPALIRRAFEQAALQREYPVNQPAIPGPIEPLTLTKVVIDPIVIPGSAEPSGGVSPVIRRVSAVDATRSPK